MSATTQSNRTHAVNHTISNRSQLEQVLREVRSGDTMTFTRGGDYGTIRLISKTNIRIRATSQELTIKAVLIIDGNAHDITIENLNIWHDKGFNKRIITTGVNTHNIVIQHCLISSVPVSRHDFQQRSRGRARDWISGIRLLGKFHTAFNNKIVNVEYGILADGAHCLVDRNQIQFFTHDAMHVKNHGIHVTNNLIQDSMLTSPDSDAAHLDAIQLIPPKDHMKAGELRNVVISGNIIKSHSNNAVPASLRGTLQGIFGSDGFFVNTVITENRVIVNSDHGITLNGAKNLQLIANSIFPAAGTATGFRPGIKLYFTRMGGGANCPVEDLDYSVAYGSNRAPLFNLPHAYEARDLGDNHFAETTHDTIRGTISHACPIAA